MGTSWQLRKVEGWGEGERFCIWSDLPGSTRIWLAATSCRAVLSRRSFWAKAEALWRRWKHTAEAEALRRVGPKQLGYLTLGHTRANIRHYVLCVKYGDYLSSKHLSTAHPPPLVRRCLGGGGHLSFSIFILNGSACVNDCIPYCSARPCSW
jgi:hypothetical protein